MLLEAGINQQLGLPLSTPFSASPPRGKPRSPLPDYEGWYGSGEGIWVHVRAGRNVLRADFRGIELTEKGLKLRPRGEDTFLLPVRGQKRPVRFVRDRRGRVSAIFVGWRVVRRRTDREREAAATGRIVW